MVVGPLCDGWSGSCMSNGGSPLDMQEEACKVHQTWALADVPQACATEWEISCVVAESVLPACEAREVGATQGSAPSGVCLVLKKGLQLCVP
ncbi:hypothetical protein D9M71_795370 [compost metagenome]